MHNSWQRVLLAMAGVVGALGVAAAAASSHGDSRNLGAVATICLAHGPALLAVALFGGRRLLLGAGLVLALGTVVFVADLAMREYAGQALFTGAAPIGGALMMLGWLGFVVVGALGKLLKIS
jgi:uncharacterized membrane protein YgdD (TMEM256/DUF423 family)